MMPSLVRETCVVGPYSTSSAPRFVWVRLTAASMSITGVPEMRRFVFSLGERNTRRLACEPSGLFIIVFSLWPGPSVHDSVSVAPPEPSARLPAEPGAVPRRNTSVACDSGIGQSEAVSKTSLATSMSTLGSSMIPFGRPWSQ